MWAFPVSSGWGSEVSSRVCEGLTVFFRNESVCSQEMFSLQHDWLWGENLLIAQCLVMSFIWSALLSLLCVLLPSHCYSTLTRGVKCARVRSFISSCIPWEPNPWPWRCKHMNLKEILMNVRMCQYLVSAASWTEPDGHRDLRWSSVTWSVSHRNTAQLKWFLTILFCIFQNLCM